MPGLRDRSRARSDNTRGQGSSALAIKQGLTQNGRQRGLKGTKALFWKEWSSQPRGGRYREGTSGVVTAPVLIWFQRAFTPTPRRHLYSNLYNNL